MERPTGRMPDYEFQKLGEKDNGYIRAEKAGALKSKFPQVVDEPDENVLYVVYDAAGDPRFITTSEEAARGGAILAGVTIWRLN